VEQDIAVRILFPGAAIRFLRRGSVDIDLPVGATGLKLEQAAVDQIILDKESALSR
jgi:hypothetical protein